LTLTPGARLGPYEITAPLGVGGMGEVYRATDTNLKRQVAIKVLPASVAGDEERLARFQREAEILAALNHPNITHIHGLEKSEGTIALVMELVEGPTLADRIGKGPIPLDEALPIAHQIADALEAAHEQGIIHRDLKPANIKVRQDGTVKVLDFGLAKAIDLSSTASNMSQSPTITTPAMTHPGLIIGTAAYMSPEQARGLVVDKRTDIWAFGCVLYELLTGRAAFARGTITDTLAAIVEREPDCTLLPPRTSPAIRRLVQRCLEKDPKRRLRDIGEARFLLEETAAGDRSPRQDFQNSPPTTAARRRLLVFGWIAAGLVVAAVLADVAVRVLNPVAGKRAAAPPVKWGALTAVTAGAGLALYPAISRDGALLAYASDRAGRDDLDIWVQQVAGGAPVRITHDTVDESEPSFSSDGARVVFRSERDGGGLYVVPALGGQEPRLLVPQGRRPRFSPDGQRIAYWTGTSIGFGSVANSYRVFTVAANGGNPIPLSGFTGARYPVWSPDGQSLLVLASRDAHPLAETYDWWLVPLDGREPIKTGAADEMRRGGVVGFDTTGNIGPGDWHEGHVLFSDFHLLWSLDLDAQTGRPANLERLTFGTNADVSPSESSNGVIVFSSYSSVNNVWSIPIDKKGLLNGTPRNVSGNGARPSASVDGRLVAYYSGQPRPTLTVKDLNTGATEDLSVASDAFGPAISPDGSRVAFESSGRQVSVVATRGGAPRVICEQCGIGDWSADGRSITVVKSEGPGGNAGRLVLINVDNRVSRDLVTSTGPLSRPFLSPDSSLLAFRSEVTNGERVFMAHVQSQSVTEADWVEVVPQELDVRPCGWSADGRLLYFVSSRDGTRCLYACQIDRTTGRPIGAAFIVRHFHGSRNIFSGSFGVLSTGPGNAIRGGYFFYDLAALTSNIWKMTPAQK
jgi:Tol biopolymer transport system component